MALAYNHYTKGYEKMQYFGIKMSHKTKRGLKHLLKNSKDKTKSFEQFGIYRNDVK